MSTAPTEARKPCSYEHQDWRCPFDAELSHELCIFHLPVDKKNPEDFWHELACYLFALMMAPNNQEVEEFVAHLPSSHWLRAQGNNWRAYRDLAARTLPWHLTGFVFPAMDKNHNFSGFVFPAVDFFGATFSTQANFREATFDGKADFRYAKFNGEADFSGAKFSGEADFWKATFSAGAYFTFAEFSGEAQFWSATFSAGAYFWHATFSGPAYLTRATVNGVLDFSHATLRNRLLFEGTVFGEKAKVLLWALNFVHGTSDITMQEGHKKGQIIEPAGQVVFRDISERMNQVSFLHTDILTDRLCIRFANVKWKTDPKEFMVPRCFMWVS